MKNITFWAAKHRTAAIMIMIALHIILMINGIVAGKMLIEEGIVLNKFFLFTGILIFIIAYFFYPVRAGKDSLFKYDLDSKIFKYSFLRHKFLDFLIAVSAFIMILYASNLNYSDKSSSIWFLQNVIASDYQSQKQSVANPANSKIVKLQLIKLDTQKNKKLRIVSLFKQKAKTKIKIVLKKNTPETNSFALKFALIILLSLAATLGLAILACAVICNGFEALGVLIFLSGLTGLILLSVFLIKKIFRRKELKFKAEKNEE